MTATNLIFVFAEKKYTKFAIKKSLNLPRKS